MNLHFSAFISYNQPNIFMTPNTSWGAILYLASLGRPKKKKGEFVFFASAVKSLPDNLGICLTTYAKTFTVFLSDISE
jgi:hypothetical protein